MVTFDVFFSRLLISLRMRLLINFILFLVGLIRRYGKLYYISERLDSMVRREAYVIFKDYKDNFGNSLSCRLINFVKSEVGLISKRIFDDINERLRKISGVIIWRSFAVVIEWFKAIEDKENCFFAVFDIVEFYSSIFEALLSEVLTWVR